MSTIHRQPYVVERFRREIAQGGYVQEYRCRSEVLDLAILEAQKVAEKWPGHKLRLVHQKSSRIAWETPWCATRDQPEERSA